MAITGTWAAVIIQLRLVLAPLISSSTYNESHESLHRLNCLVWNYLQKKSCVKMRKREPASQNNLKLHTKGFKVGYSGSEGSWAIWTACYLLGIAAFLVQIFVHFDPIVASLVKFFGGAWVLKLQLPRQRPQIFLLIFFLFWLPATDWPGKIN